MLENDLTKWGLTKTIGRHFFEPTLKLILFPMFLIIGGIVSGNMTDDAVHSEMLLAGFGLGELSVAILSLSILHAFNRNIKSKLEEHFYDGDKEGIQRIIYQQIWLDTLIFLISCIPFLFIDSIYGMLNQNVQIATYAKQFAIPFLPGVYFFTISSLFFDYAEVQRKNTQSFIALLVGMLSLLMFNKFLVGGVGLQLTGVGVASSIGLFLQMIVIVGLNWSDIFGSNRQENVEFCGSDTFFGIGQRFTESAKSCILNLGALWAFELCVLIASYISP